MQSIKNLLKECFKLGIDIITINDASKYEECYFEGLVHEDVDWVTFHRDHYSAPRICDKLVANNIVTSPEPIYKDWYMTVNFH